MENGPKLPLDGVRVLDLSRVLAGPYATMVLGDLGADVLKVEHPERGDDTRHWGPPFSGGESAYFLSVNRNKRSIGVDLKDQEGLERVKKLAAGADVLIENWRRGALEKLGLGYKALMEENPDLIYCSVTGFGPGPDEDRPGYDFLVQARGGVMGITGQPGGEPTKVGVAISDIVCGLFASNAILAALYRRSATGEGARIEVPLFESTLGWLANLGRAIGRPELAEDERYATNPDRVSNREALISELQQEFGKRTADEWAEEIRAAGVPSGPVNTLADVFADEHVLGSGMLQAVDHPSAGPLEMVASPVIVDGEHLPIRHAPPTLGQHTEEGWQR